MYGNDTVVYIHAITAELAAEKLTASLVEIINTAVFLL